MMRVARDLGIEVSDATFEADGHDHVYYSWGGRSLCNKSGWYLPILSDEVDALCRGKSDTKAMLDRIGIPTPRSCSFPMGSEHEAIRARLETFMAARRSPEERYGSRPFA